MRKPWELGHGTHAAGIVAGQAVNESNLPHIGVASAAYILIAPFEYHRPLFHQLDSTRETLNPTTFSPNREIPIYSVKSAFCGVRVLNQ